MTLLYNVGLMISSVNITNTRARPRWYTLPMAMATQPLALSAVPPLSDGRAVSPRILVT